MVDVRMVYQPEVGQVVDTAGLAAWLATDAGRAAIRAGVRAELRDLSVVLADNAAEIFNLGDRNDPVGRALFLVACDIAKFTSKPAAPCEPAAGAWDVKGLVDRFLAWKLPRSVCADLCATRQQEGRSGTNLLSADEARQMIEHLLATPPAAPDALLPGRETGWVIESGGSPNEYWHGRFTTTQGFTRDINQAVRFARREDGEVVRCWLLGDIGKMCRTSDHAWVPNPRLLVAGADAEIARRGGA